MVFREKPSQIREKHDNKTRGTSSWGLMVLVFLSVYKKAESVE